MYPSINITIILAAVSALSSSLSPKLVEIQKTLQAPPCDQRPLVTVDTITATELNEATKNLLPKVSSNGTRNIIGFQPQGVEFSPVPKTNLIKDIYFDQLSKLTTNNSALFRRKEVINHRDYPWRTIGKVQTYDTTGHPIGGCSGTSIGRNLLLTASHCVPWTRPDKSWTMEFIPSFNGEDPTDPRPFGTAWVSRCRGVRNTDDVTGLDYVICQLIQPIGDTIGWMGWEASSGDDFYYNGRWTSVGYPGDSHGGAVPMVEDRIALDDVDDEGSDGKELESYVYSSHGWSGGPLFHLTGGSPRVVGVMSGWEKEFSFWDFFVKEHTVSAGGLHMGALITYGRTNWLP